LRKMMLRVLGTVAGATIGVALALATPDNTVVVVLFAAACIFLTIYSSPISYPQMVFWLNLGFVMVYTLLGAREMDLLFARPSTTLLGALVAALVVVFVFPIRTVDRFKAALARFLGAVDAYIAAFVDAVTDGNGTQPLDAAQAKVAATYSQVEQTLPGVAYENSPMIQAQSPITRQASRITALEAEVTRLADATSEPRIGAEGTAAWMRAVQARIHADIQAITPLLSGERGQAPKAIGPYSQAIRAGDFLFLSGQIPLDAATGQLVPGDVAAQTRQVLDNLRAVLAASGHDLEAVVRTTIYLADLSDFAVVNEVYRGYFADPAPARATVQVARLPRDARVEIDAVAYVK